MLILALEISSSITSLRMNLPDDNSSGRRPLPPGARPLPPTGNANPPASMDDIPTAKPIRNVTSATVPIATTDDLLEQDGIPSPDALPQVDSHEVTHAPVGDVVLENAVHKPPVSQDSVEEIVQSAKYSAPYWVMSLLVHTLILIVLGLSLIHI